MRNLNLAIVKTKYDAVPISQSIIVFDSLSELVHRGSHHNNSVLYVIATEANY